MKQISIITFSFLLIFLSSCYKEDPTTATVEVLRAKDSTIVEKMNVRLYYDGSDRIDTVLRTNSLGQVEIDFSDEFKAGQSGFVVLDVDLKFTDTTGEYKVGVIKVEQEEDNFQKVYCQGC